MDGMMLLDRIQSMGYALIMSKIKRFSDELRAAVDGSGMTRYRICKELGMSEAEMSRFMAGKCGLGLKTIDRLAAFLDLHLRKGR